MRIFGSDKMTNLMRKLGVERGEAITHPWVSRAIENAQRKVEGHNFDIRKQLLEYDNVANDQRRVIYDQRDILMATDDISDNIQACRESVVNTVISEHIPPESVEDMWDIPGLEKAIAAEFGSMLPIHEWLEKETHLHEETLRNRILTEVNLAYEAKESQVGKETMRRLEKSVMLHSLDIHWREHLNHMEYLRQSIFLRGYAQKDPKQEYKREAFSLFGAMLESIKRQVVSMLSLVEISAASDVEAVEALNFQQNKNIDQSLEFRHASLSALEITGRDQSEMDLSERLSAAGAGGVSTAVRMAPKVGRNDLCPCGSSKKYKHCHGRLE